MIILHDTNFHSRHGVHTQRDTRSFRKYCISRLSAWLFLHEHVGIVSVLLVYLLVSLLDGLLRFFLDTLASFVLCWLRPSCCLRAFLEINDPDERIDEHRIDVEPTSRVGFVRSEEPMKSCVLRAFYASRLAARSHSARLSTTASTNPFCGLFSKIVLLTVEVVSGLSEDLRQPLRSPKKGAWLEPLAVPAA